MTEDVNVQEKKMKNFSGFDLFCFYLLLLFKSSGFKDEELCEKGGKLGKIGKYTNINEKKYKQEETKSTDVSGIYTRVCLFGHFLPLIKTQTQMACVAYVWVHENIHYKSIEFYL